MPVWRRDTLMPTFPVGGWGWGNECLVISFSRRTQWKARVDTYSSDFSVSKCDHFSAKWRVRVCGFLKGPLSIMFWFLSAVLQIRRVSPDRKKDVIAPELNGTGNSAVMRLPPGVFGNESLYLQFLSLEISQTKSVTCRHLNPRTILGDVITETTQKFIFSKTFTVIYYFSWV